MTSPSHWRPRLQIAALALFFEIAHLAWEALHGGIRVHHLMQRADLPALHNAWGLLVLPLLAGWAVTRVQRRGAIRAQWIAGFAAALVLGGALSVSFYWGSESFTSSIFFSTVALAVVLPGYRAECLLGWVLGMAWAFGALLPTFIGTGIVALSAGVHWVAWQVLKRFWPKRRSASSAK